LGFGQKKEEIMEGKLYSPVSKFANWAKEVEDENWGLTR